jgi:hypothetical protein
MALVQEQHFVRDAHPLDVIEQVAHAHEWAFERTSDDEIAIAITGRHAQYTVSYSWMDDCEALHLACAFDMKAPRARMNEVLRLVSLVNEQLLMGHFDYWYRDNMSYGHRKPRVRRWIQRCLKLLERHE